MEVSRKLFFMMVISMSFVDRTGAHGGDPNIGSVGADAFGLTPQCSTVVQPLKTNYGEIEKIFSSIIEAKEIESLDVAEAEGCITQKGTASWYGGNGDGFAGKLTASGTRFRPAEMTAAHKRLPFGTRLLVTDLKTKKRVLVTVNDRGPYKPGRIIDLSMGAAQKLGIASRGVANVEISSCRPAGKTAGL